MTTKSTVTEAPYDKNGLLMHHAVPGARWPEVAEWRPNTPFEATLTIVAGRSAKYLTWTDEAGKRWPMFVAELVDAVRRTTLGNGQISGTWVVRKRGQNYGLGLAREQNAGTSSGPARKTTGAAAIRAKTLRSAAADLLATEVHEDLCSYGPPGTCDCALGEHYRWLLARAGEADRG